MNKVLESLIPCLRPLVRLCKVCYAHPGELDVLKWYFLHSRRLGKFKNIHAGESCFIIGNGPSLKKMDLRPLRNHHTFGLNKIYLLFDEVDIDLSYHVAVNRLVIEQSMSEFEKMQCPAFLSYKASRGLLNKHKDMYYILTGGFGFGDDLRGLISEGHTVTYVAMQIAFYMGFREIYLIGVDHSFVSQGKPNEQQLMEGRDPNHFHPDYFAGKEWQLPDLEASELAYMMARYYFRNVGRTIYDATIEGKLQIFPKISYEDALRRCSRKSSK